MKTTICCYNIMTIADINSLPVISLNVTGREGSGTSVTVIDQESKDVTQTTNFSYIQGESLTLTIEDQVFIDRLEKNSTLSVILYNETVPLYRDIIRFRGELNTANEYTQYNNEDDYFIYESEQFEEDDPHVDYGGGDISGSETGSSNVTTYVPIDLEGKTVIDLPDDVITPSENYSVVYDKNNNGRGEMRGGSSYEILQASEETQGDFKVRSAEYGTFNSSPSSLESVTVYQYNFNSNTGNTFGYHPSQLDLSVNPDLINTLESYAPTVGDFKYFHFRNGRDEAFSDTVTLLEMREENSLDNSAFETTVYKEDSISDWTVGMSIYSDATGTSVTDNYVDTYATTNDIDRYHFISKNSSGVWVLVRCTDGIVTHVEAVDSVNYVRLAEMYSVSITTNPYETRPTGKISSVKPWVEAKLADPNAVFYRGSQSVDYTTVKFSINGNSYNRDRYRKVLDLEGGVLGSVGSRVYSHIGPLNVQNVFHKQLVSTDGDSSLIGASDEDRYGVGVFSPWKDFVNNLEFNEQPWLLLEIDKATGLISDREWINL